jgi:hypothetical protein
MGEDDPLEAEPCERQFDVVGRLSVSVGMADRHLEKFLSPNPREGQNGFFR